MNIIFVSFTSISLNLCIINGNYFQRTTAIPDDYSQKLTVRTVGVEWLEKCASFFAGGVTWAMTSDEQSPIDTNLAIGELFEDGNRAYLEGDFQRALHYWLLVEKKGVKDGRLFYNIGNAYYRLNEIGEAILYWERAIKFIGSDPDVVANLELVRRQYNIQREERVTLPIWQFIDRIKDFFPERVWAAILLLGIYGLFIALAFRRWLAKSFPQRSWAGKIAQIFVILIFTGGVFIYLDARENKVNRYGVIVNPSAEVISSPSTAFGKLLFTLPEGSKCHIKRKIGEYYEIWLGKERQGWIKESDVGII